MRNSTLHRIKTAAILLLFTVAAAGQDEETKEMPQYLFPSFSSCEVLMKDHQVINQVLNYNLVSEKMVYSKDGKYFDLMNPSLIDTVYLNTRKFVTSGATFNEVLLSGSLPLFVHHKARLISAGKPVGYGSSSQGVTSYYLSKHELSPEYINIHIPPNVQVIAEPVFMVMIKDELLTFENEKDFLSLFPGLAAEIKSFIKSNRIKIKEKDDLISLVKYISSLEN